MLYMYIELLPKIFYKPVVNQTAETSIAVLLQQVAILAAIE